MPGNSFVNTDNHLMRFCSIFSVMIWNPIRKKLQHDTGMEKFGENIFTELMLDWVHRTRMVSIQKAACRRMMKLKKQCNMLLFFASRYKLHSYFWSNNSSSAFVNIVEEHTLGLCCIVARIIYSILDNQNETCKESIAILVNFTHTFRSWEI